MGGFEAETGSVACGDIGICNSSSIREIIGVSSCMIEQPGSGSGGGVLDKVLLSSFVETVAGFVVEPGPVFHWINEPCT